MQNPGLQRKLRGSLRKCGRRASKDNAGTMIIGSSYSQRRQGLTPHKIWTTHSFRYTQEKNSIPRLALSLEGGPYDQGFSCFRGTLWWECQGINLRSWTNIWSWIQILELRTRTAPLFKTSPIALIIFFWGPSVPDTGGFHWSIGTGEVSFAKFSRRSTSWHLPRRRAAQVWVVLFGGQKPYSLRQ